MDSRLEEKVTFFENLRVHQYDDTDDALGADEEAYRQRTRAFHSATLATPTMISPITKAETVQQPGVIFRRTSSDSRSSNSEVEIVFSRRNNNSRAGTPCLPPNASIGDDSIIPETVAAALKTSHHHTAHPLLRTKHSSPLSDPSPSVAMGKRKKEASLELAPEAEQIFKGLSFYYIPNDDINPTRNIQITKAREHGAMWCRELIDATHIIVDKKLTYPDIERQLLVDPRSSEKVLVNETYPVDCLRHGEMANPDQYQYRIVGVSTSSKQPAPASSFSDDSNHSLRLKPKRPKATKRSPIPTSSTPSGSEISSQRSTSFIPSSQMPHREQTALLTTDEDELTQCINETKAAGDVDNSGSVLVDDGVAGSPSTKDKFDALSDSVSSADERPRKKKLISNSEQKTSAWQENFVCSRGGTIDQANNNPNAETIEVLQKMLDVHANAADNFRIRAYRLAIATLRAQSKKICTAEEARTLPHIGRIADKIEEIVNTNRLRQLEYALDDPRQKTMGLFLKIYGVGKTHAQKWVAQGHRTLEDLREKADLNPNQKVGLEHFEDLNTRIPRSEVEALAKCVKEKAAAIDSGVEIIVGGSYRRGADSSGDIDLIITKGGTNHTNELTSFLSQLVETLTQEGFLTATLASHHSSTDDVDGGSKWHGCCVIPQRAFTGPKSEAYRPIWRRIDLLLVPQAEMGAALIYFTGNDIFNRSIRLLAHKKGMRLNQRGLYRDVLPDQGSARMTAGTLLEARDERKIFGILGVRWREPHERWCG